METKHDHRSGDDLITGPATNLDELHHTSPVTEQGHGSTFNSHFETNHSAFGNNPGSPSSLSSSSNPFLLPSDATYNTGNGGMMSDGSSSTYPAGSIGETNHSSTVEVLGPHLSFEPFAHESSQGNPFQWPNNTNNEDPFGAFESRQNQPSAYETVPTNVESHDAFPVINQGHQSMASSNLETSFSSTSESLSQEPIQVSVNASSTSHTDTHQQSAYETAPTNVESHNAFPAIEQGHKGMGSCSNLAIPFSSASESSQEPTQVSVNASSMPHTNTYQPSANETVPTNAESVIEQGHQSMASSNLEAPFSSASECSSQEPVQVSVNATSKSQIDTHVPPILEMDTQKVAETSGDDVPSSSMPKHGQYSAAAAPGFEGESGTNKGVEIQNPPVQVMKRSEDSDTSSQYIFPSHVFARNNTNAPVEWSATSNESLFSIYMGNMSFSSELVCFNKSNDLDKPSDVSMLDPSNASTSHEPPAPMNKFNNISQSTAELHEESRSITEAKAAETMREVIMETSQTTKNDDKGGHSSSNSHRQSDGSAKSYAFQLSTDRDKKISSGGDEEKQTQQQSDKQQEKANANADDNAPKSTTNAAPNRCLSCFACCTFCQ